MMRHSIRAASAVLSAFLLFSLAGCSSGSEPSNNIGTQYADKAYGFQLEAPAAGEQVAVMHTSKGDITLRFFPEAAPKAVQNFKEHAEKVYMIREVTAIQKLNMDVQAASDRLATIESGDILVTATTATEPIIHGAEIKKGVYVAHLGDNEVDEELILRADKVVIDDWETDKHRVGDTMAYMFRDGKIDDSRIDASVSDLVTGRKSGRDNDDQLTYTCNVGLGLYDVAIAARVYQYAKGNGIGQKLKLWDEPIMV